MRMALVQEGDGAADHRCGEARPGEWFDFAALARLAHRPAPDTWGGSALDGAWSGEQRGAFRNGEGVIGDGVGIGTRTDSEDSRKMRGEDSGTGRTLP